MYQPRRHQQLVVSVLWLLCMVGVLSASIPGIGAEAQSVGVVRIDSGSAVSQCTKDNPVPACPTLSQALDVFREDETIYLVSGTIDLTLNTGTGTGTGTPPTSFPRSSILRQDPDGATAVLHGGTVTLLNTGVTIENVGFEASPAGESSLGV
jgi:hypothetical protein